MAKTLTSNLIEVGCTRNWRWAMVDSTYSIITSRRDSFK